MPTIQTAKATNEHQRKSTKQHKTEHTTYHNQQVPVNQAQSKTTNNHYK